MPHNRKRPSINPRFLIESNNNVAPPPNVKNNKTRTSPKLPVDMQIFRLMGHTVAGSAKDYPLIFPDFVSRFIAPGGDDSDSADAKLRSWKILTELNQLKQQQQQCQQLQQVPSVEIVSQHAETLFEKSLSQEKQESTSANSLSSSINTQSLDQRNASQLLALAQAKVSGGPKKLLSRSMGFNTNSLLPQSLVVGGRSISRPNTPGVPVPFVRGIINNRANSISAAAAPASKPLTTPVYAQLLNSAPSALPSTSGMLNHKPIPMPDALQRSLQLSPLLGNLELVSNNTSVNGSGSGSASSSGNNDSRNNITAVAAMAFSRGMRIMNGSSTSTRYSSALKTAPVPLANSNTFALNRYPDPLYGINSPTNSVLSDLYKKRISEITIFTEQTIRFEQRKANRAHRSVVSGVVVAPMPTSSCTPGSGTQHNLNGTAPSPPCSPLSKYIQRTMSPIEPRKGASATDDEKTHFSDEEDEDDSDAS